MCHASILVVDDEPIIRDSLAEFLTAEGFTVAACGSAEEALRLAAQTPFAVALCDVQLPGIDGLELLNRLLKLGPQTFVLLITAYGTVDNAIAAFQRGAHDYLLKPIILTEVLAKIQRLLRYRELHLENQHLRRELHRESDRDMVVGPSFAMQRVLEIVRRVAPTPSTVLIVGESGTGKELVARAIHRQGAAPDGRFLALNCAAIPHELLENQLFGHRKGAFTGADRDQAGIFVHAGSGTVFLDEIGEAPWSTQAKLLRAIEQKEILPVGANEPIKVDARILAATNKNLTKEVEVGRFREDLFYRLNVVTIAMPPLRERREDIPDLVEALLAKHAQTLGKRITGVSHEAMRILLACPWKGNVRELDNALQRAVILGEGPLIVPADLPPDLVPHLDDPALVDDLGEAVRRFEKLHIERILRRSPDKKEAARLLGVGLSSLYRRIAELGIEPS
ncbi:MAG: sigma-54-dependent Fis family transcriptional regulator [Planctomycetes bacterium]|nr:sigma-54-dependent Fis family transcriptional regulator [Planctomycetota bacterium]